MGLQNWLPLQILPPRRQRQDHPWPPDDNSSTCRQWRHKRHRRVGDRIGEPIRSSYAAGVTSLGADIVGRQPELQAVRAFLDGRSSAAATLLLDGEAGVRKTTIWQAGVDEARRRGLTILVARPAEGEAALPFAALGDLVEPVHDAAAVELPAPQREALDAALQRSFTVGPVTQLAVSRAVAELLRTVVANRALLVAVDDVQWLDAPSQHVLEFALRRLASSPVRILLARRSDRALPVPLGLERAPFEGAVSRVRVEPLSASELGTLRA